MKYLLISDAHVKLTAYIDVDEFQRSVIPPVVVHVPSLHNII